MFSKLSFLMYLTRIGLTQVAWSPYVMIEKSVVAVKLHILWIWWIRDRNHIYYLYKSLSDWMWQEKYVLWIAMRLSYHCMSANNFSNSVKIKVENFDRRINFILWQIQVKDVWIQSRLHKVLKGKTSPASSSYFGKSIVSDEDWEEFD